MATDVETPADDLPQVDDPTTTEDRLAELEEWEEAVREARLNEKAAKVEYERRKAATKTAKAEWEEAVEAMGEAIDQKPGKYPLFEQQADQGPVEPAEWRSTPLADIIAPTTAAKLAECEASITTIGDLQDFVNAQGDLWWRDVPGIGEGKAEKIGDAVAQWFADHPEFREPEEPEPVEPEAEASTDPGEGLACETCGQAVAEVVKCGDCGKLVGACCEESQTEAEIKANGVLCRECAG